MDEVIFHLLHGPFLHLLSLGAQHREDLGKQGPTCSFLLTHQEDATFTLKLLLIVSIFFNIFLRIIKMKAMPQTKYMTHPLRTTEEENSC